jgi:hypothetical protein
VAGFGPLADSCEVVEPQDARPTMTAITKAIFFIRI